MLGACWQVVWDKLVAQHPRKVESSTQVGVRILYVFFVIFCSFGLHFVDSGHYFVESVKN